MDLNVARELDSPTVISDEVGGETLAINIATGSYFVIPTASVNVWRALSSGVPAQMLLKGPDDARSDALRDFVAVLVAAGLLRNAANASPLLESFQWTARDLIIEEHTDMADILGLDPIHEADENVGWPARRSDD
jgi:hypothetical protein